MRQVFRTVFMNCTPIMMSALIAAVLVGVFYNEHYSAELTSLSDYGTADSRFFSNVESCTYEGDKNDILVISGWAADTRLYSGYNYGAEMTVTSVYNESYFALVDGEEVYRLKTIASGREDINGMFPETVLPEGVARRFGIKGFARCGKGIPKDPSGLEICVISVRKDEGPVIQRTGVMVP